MNERILMAEGNRTLPLRLFRLVEFLFFYVIEVVSSNLRVAMDILTPKHLMDPAFIEVELQPMTDLQLLMLTNLITMTPGTLSIDVRPDRSRLYIHSMYTGEPEAFRAKIKRDYERRVLNVF